MLHVLLQMRCSAPMFVNNGVFLGSKLSNLEVQPVKGEEAATMIRVLLLSEENYLRLS